MTISKKETKVKSKYKSKTKKVINEFNIIGNNVLIFISLVVRVFLWIVLLLNHYSHTHYHYHY